MRTLSLFFVLLISIFQIHSTVLINEIFDYEPSNLEQVSAWTTTTSVSLPPSAGTGREIHSSALTYSDQAGSYVHSGAGKTLYNNFVGGNGVDYKNYRSFPSVNNDKVYLSFLFQPRLAQSQSQSEVFGLAQSTNPGAKLWVGRGIQNISHFRFGVTTGKTSSGDIQWGSAEYSDINKVYLLVLKHDFSTNITSLFVDPSVGSTQEPSTVQAKDESDNRTNRTSLDNLWFRLAGNNKACHNISGVRVSTKWEEAVADNGEEPEPEPTAWERINTDFGDGTWGKIETGGSAYASGSYPSSTINGFNLVKAFMLNGSMTCPEGEVHNNRIAVDKLKEGGAIDLPLLKTVGEIEIHAVAGTEGNPFKLEEWVSNNWQLIGSYPLPKTPDGVISIPLERNVETKLRVANNSGGGIYIYKIKTRSLQDVKDLNIRTSSPTEGEIVFSNLKKSITLTFTKEVVLNTGQIYMNDEPLGLTAAMINGTVVEIPVVLTTTTGSNKNYRLRVAQGCLAEKGNETNLSKEVIVNFQTIKSVLYPDNYTAEIDVVYKQVNSPNCRMDVYYPTSSATPVPVIINMHGGGWVSGAKEEQGGFTPFFNAGYAVANVEYRMRNEALAPAAVEDVRAAMLYLLQHPQYNIDPYKIVFQGGSAGGHLALTAAYLQNNRIYDNDMPAYEPEIKVCGVLDKYGATDLITFAPVYSSMRAWLGDRYSDTEFVKSISPIEMVNPQTPPTYIIHGDADPTIPYSQSEVLYAALQQAGVKSQFTTVPGGGHGGFPTDYNNQMTSEMMQFLSEIFSAVTADKALPKEADLDIFSQNGIIRIDTKESFVATLYTLSGQLLTTTSSSCLPLDYKGCILIKIATAKKVSVHKLIL